MPISMRKYDPLSWEVELSIQRNQHHNCWKKINKERVDGSNQGITLLKTVPFLQNTNIPEKNPIAIDCGKIIETICYVTNTHPRYTPSFIQWP